MALTAMGQRSDFWGQRATLFEVLPVDSTQIVFLGNSITNGCEWHELLNNPKVINRGISGDVVDGVLERLNPIIKGHPKKIFLMIGVNDVSHDLSADSIANACENLIRVIRTESPTTELYMQSALPVRLNGQRWKGLIGKEQLIRDYNALLRPKAEALGATWIDLYTPMADENGNLKAQYTNDGLHLLGPAYLLWKEIITPYID